MWKGTTGIIFYYERSPISWSTQKQATVALSSCESEFIAATAAATQALWLKRLLSRLTHSDEEKITILVDNKSAIALMKNPVFHGGRQAQTNAYIILPMKIETSERKKQTEGKKDSCWTFQGVLFPMLFHLHAQTCLHRSPLSLSKHAIFVFGIMSIHSTVLVIFKDIPDVEGDKIDGIDSFACKFGPKPVFAHSILGFKLWRKANLVDLKNNEAVESFYLFIWK
ncbi:hypothetical protein Tco_1141669, partial [Tanacetum coccineum]